MSLSLRGPGQVQVLSCYESGHQPLGVASPLAFLERAGYAPQALDLAVEPLDRLFEPASGRDVGLVAVSVPMHTALRIGVRAARRIRRRFPSAHLCFYGLYAVLNAEHLLDGPADSVLGGECEPSLVALAAALEDGRPLDGVRGLRVAGRSAPPPLVRLDFPPPARHALPGPERYARLEWNGERRVAAAVETSRGCLHHCRHCPIPPVYGGRFFVVPRDVVLADVRRLVARGVRHVTFADPDFLNGPGHATAIARELHAEFPDLTFDLTTKIELVLRHRRRFAELAECGCIFVVSAVESLSDTVLGHLRKGHTRSDVLEALRILDGTGIALRPSLVAFTPWTTIDDYMDVLDWIETEDLAGHVDPVQLSIRLLVPPGSLLASSPALHPHLGPLQPDRFSWAWTHPDPRMDRLHETVSEIVQRAASGREPGAATLERIRAAALATRGASATVPASRARPARLRAAPPRLTEPWFC